MRAITLVSDKVWRELGHSVVLVPRDAQGIRGRFPAVSTAEADSLRTVIRQGTTREQYNAMLLVAQLPVSQAMGLVDSVWEAARAGSQDTFDQAISTLASSGAGITPMVGRSLARGDTTDRTIGLLVLRWLDTEAVRAVLPKLVPVMKDRKLPMALRLQAADAALRVDLGHPLARRTVREGLRSQSWGTFTFALEIASRGTRLPALKTELEAALRTPGLSRLSSDLIWETLDRSSGSQKTEPE